MKLNKLSFIALGFFACLFLVFLVSYDYHLVRATDDKKPKIHILFIGNSYTFVNDLPTQLETLASNEIRPVVADSVTEGGATLKKHWNDGKALAAIKKGGWDYVVLQEHSTFGSTLVVNDIAQLNDPTDFYTYARLFDAEIKKVGAKTLFYMTWARQNAPQNQAIIAKTYMTIAGELHDDVVPVGLGWATSLKERPSLLLYQADKSHPNPDGTFLAACVFYVKLYHKSPAGFFGSIDVTAHDAKFLQTVAWETVQQQNEQPVNANKHAESINQP